MLSGNTSLNQEFSSTLPEKFWKHLVSVLETMMGLNKHAPVSEGRPKMKRKAERASVLPERHEKA